MKLGQTFACNGWERPEGFCESAWETVSPFGANSIYLEAQKYAIGYYAKEGFEVVSDEFLEDGIPHVKMERRMQARG